MDEITLPSKPSDLGFTAEICAFLEPGWKFAQEVSLSKDSRPIDILSALTARLGPEWIAWEPETLWAEARRAFGATWNDLLKNKVEAAKTLLVSGAFWSDHLVFEKVVMAFNGLVPYFDQYQHPSPAMVGNAIEEVGKIRKAAFSDEVLRYIAAICFDASLIVLPEPLDVAQESLDELTAPVVGQHLRDEIRSKWAQLSLNGPSRDMYTETVVGAQVARMAAIREYIKTE